MESLTPYERQVLIAIGKGCKPNSPIKGRRWTVPPIDMPEMQAALRHLGMHKMIQRKGGMWMAVRPTAKGWRQIEWEKQSRLSLNRRGLRSFAIGGKSVGNDDEHEIQ